MADAYADLIAAASGPTPAGPAPATDAYQDLLDATAAPAPPAPKPAVPQAPDRGTVDAAARSLGNGASVGMGPQFNAGLETIISKVPWLRDLAAKTGFADPSVINPNFTYGERLKSYADALDRSREQHPVVSAIGETVGGLATAPIAPEAQLVKTPGFLARAVNAAVPNALLGATQAANESIAHGKSGTEVIKDAALGGTTAGVTGGLIGAGIGKLVDAAPEKADQWIVKEIAGTDHATNPTATAKKQLANDAADVRNTIKNDPELAKAASAAADGDIEKLKEFRQLTQDRLNDEKGPRLERYENRIDPASKYGGMRVGDIVEPLKAHADSLDIGDDKVKRALNYWTDQIKEGWGTKERVKIDPEAEVAPGFKVQEALDNYRQRLVEAKPEDRPAIEATIKQLEDQFGTKVREYDPNTVIPTTRFRKFVTKTGQDVANAIGTIDEKARYQHLRDVERPFMDILNNHLDEVAKRSPEAEKAVQETREANKKISALLNMQKVADQRINRATSNAMAGMRPAFGIRGAIHQAVGPGVPGVVAATLLGHPAVAAGLGLTTVAPGLKKSADQALAQLLLRARAGSVPAQIVEEAIRHGVPRAVALRVASSASGGAVNKLATKLTADQ